METILYELIEVIINVELIKKFSKKNDEIDVKFELTKADIKIVLKMNLDRPTYCLMQKEAPQTGVLENDK